MSTSITSGVKSGNPDTAGAAADYSRAADLARECGAPELIAAALLGLGLIGFAVGLILGLIAFRDS